MGIEEADTILQVLDQMERNEGSTSFADDADRSFLSRCR